MCVYIYVYIYIARDFNGDKLLRCSEAFKKPLAFGVLVYKVYSCFLNVIPGQIRLAGLGWFNRAEQNQLGTCGERGTVRE